MNIKKPHKTVALLLHSAVILIISYIIVLWVIAGMKSLAFFSVLEESGEIPMSDMYMYINSKKEPARLDTNITLVNIDSCKDRFEIARLIQQIDSLQPKVIGLDVFFRNWKTPKEDMFLDSIIRTCKNIVLACILDEEDREYKDTYSICNRNFFVIQEEDLNEGFINLDSDGNSTVQTFTPKLYVRKSKSVDTLNCFAVQTVRSCNETAFRKLLQRKENLERINFQPLRFYEMDKKDIAYDAEWITDKIIIMGSLSEDLHKTPINLQMQGVEIHAHIISTILEEKYIDRLDNIWTKMINIFLCYLFTVFCWIATTKLSKGVTMLIKLAEVAILLLVFFTGYYLFNHLNIDITHTRAFIVMGVVVLIADIYNVSVTFGKKYIYKLNIFNQHEKDNH